MITYYNIIEIYSKLIFLLLHPLSHFKRRIILALNIFLSIVLLSNSILLFSLCSAIHSHKQVGSSQFLLFSQYLVILKLSESSLIIIFPRTFNSLFSIITNSFIVVLIILKVSLLRITSAYDTLMIYYDPLYT